MAVILTGAELVAPGPVVSVLVLAAWIVSAGILFAKPGAWQIAAGVAASALAAFGILLVISLAQFLAFISMDSPPSATDAATGTWLTLLMLVMVAALVGGIVSIVLGAAEATRRRNAVHRAEPNRKAAPSNQPR